MSKYQALIDALNGDDSLFSNVRNGEVRALLADLEGAEKALAALAQQAQEPVGDRYFSYSTDMGFEEFATQQEAIDCSNVQINGYRDDAIRDDEWPDEVDSVCWGVILGRSKEIDTSNEDHESVDYKLYTTPPAPQVPERDAEIAELRAEVLAWRKQCDRLTHQVICCGVAASHPDATLTTRGAYAGKWNSGQAEEVRKLRAERDALAALQSPAPQTKGGE